MLFDPPSGEGVACALKDGQGVAAGDGLVAGHCTTAQHHHDAQGSLEATEIAQIMAQHREHVPGKDKRIAGYEVGFVVLGPDGVPFTNGDERYRTCLGRETSPSK